MIHIHKIHLLIRTARWSLVWLTRCEPYHGLIPEYSDYPRKKLPYLWVALLSPLLPSFSPWESFIYWNILELEWRNRAVWLNLVQLKKFLCGNNTLQNVMCNIQGSEFKKPTSKQMCSSYWYSRAKSVHEVLQEVWKMDSKLGLFLCKHVLKSCGSDSWHISMNILKATNIFARK